MKPHPVQPKALLTLNAVSFGFDDSRLFCALTLSLLAGQALVLCGSNGSGKSTLLRLMAGLTSPDEGEVVRALHDTGERYPIAWLGHALGLKHGCSVSETLRFARDLQGTSAGQSFDQALRDVGLPGFETVPIRELSAGQRKRVALATLLVAPAPIWLLDEPHANLDPDGCRMVDRLVSEQLANGGAVAMSLHDPDLARFVGDRNLVHLNASATA